jgi:hypothetical protein
MPRRSRFAFDAIATLLLTLAGVSLLAAALAGRLHEADLYGLGGTGTQLGLLGAAAMLLLATVIALPHVRAWQRRRRFRWVLRAEGA